MTTPTTGREALLRGEEISLVAAEHLMSVIAQLGAPPADRDPVAQGAIILHHLATRHGFVMVPKEAAPPPMEAIAAYRRDLAERLPKALWEVGAYPEGDDEGDIRRSALAVLRLIEETP